jgi:hypothetical protein
MLFPGSHATEIVRLPNDKGTEATSMMVPTVSLSSEQVRFYRENGYLSIPNLMPADEVDWMRVVYDRLFREKAGREVGDQFDLAGTDEDDQAAVLPQILGPAKYAP